MVPSRHIIRAMLSGDHERVCALPPSLSPEELRAIPWHALRRYGLPAAPRTVETLLGHEGFTVYVYDVPCGCTTDELIILPRAAPDLVQLVALHERAHAWLARLGHDSTNETDAWLLTAASVRFLALHDWPIELPRWWFELLESAA